VTLRAKLKENTKDIFVENVERGEFYVKIFLTWRRNKFRTTAVSLKAQEKLNQPYD